MYRLINGKPTLSCFDPCDRVAEGKEILTIEGIGDAAKGELHPPPESLCGTLRGPCGFCTPAMILTAKALLDKNPNPVDEEIREAIQRVICRCYRVYAELSIQF